MPEGIGGLFSGLIKGFGNTMLEMEDRAHQDRVEQKRTRLRLLEAAVNNPDLDDDSRQTALDELGTVMLGDGKGKGGKQLEQYRNLVEPIAAVTRLLGERPARSGKLPTELAPSQMDDDDGRGGTASSFAIQPAPKRAQAADLHERPLRIKTTAQKHAEALALDEARTRQAQALALANDAARIKQQFALENQERAADLERIWGENQKAIERDMSIARKYYRDPKTGKPLADTDPLPDVFNQAIIDKHLGIKRPTAAAVKAQGAVEGPNLPDDATDLEGNPIADRKRGSFYKPMYQGTTLLGYQRDDRRPLAAEVKFAQEVQAAMAANTGMTEQQATQLVRRQSYEKRRLDLVNAQELATGRNLGNQLKKDVQDGKLSRVGAQYLLNGARLRANSLAKLARDGELKADSPYVDKTAPEIEEMLIEESGWTREQLTEAIAPPKQGPKTDSPRIMTREQVRALAIQKGMSVEETTKQLKALKVVIK